MVRMNDHIVDRTSMAVVSLYRARLCVPDLDCSIFRRSHHPLGFAVKSDCGDIARVSIETEKRIWIVAFAGEELDAVIASRSDDGFVG